MKCLILIRQYRSSAKNLFKHDTPKETDRFMGMIASGIGCLCGFGLSVYKYTVGTRLDSPAIVADGISSLCSAFTSFTALVVSYLENTVWWADSTSGTIIVNATSQHN
jgi:divalent metal cation (Fe/Co/Zn/Cd) transporter